MNYFKKFGVMIDCSRNSVLNVGTFKKMVDYLAKLGYNSIRLYTEDTYEVEGEPYFGYLRGKYSKEEIKEMDAYAKSKGIELIPCIQTLAHLATIFRYADYGPIKDIEDILLVNDERTYKLIDNMFKSISTSFSSKNIHIGMDEAHLAGRGNYLSKFGLEDRAVIIKKHLDKVLQLASKYNFKCEIWGDMFYNSAFECKKDDSKRISSLVPSNLKLCCWDYYHVNKKDYVVKIKNYQKLTSNVSFAGGAWTWLGFCPDNSYSLKITESAMKACKEQGIEEFYLTMWGDNGGECSPFGVLPTLVVASEYNKGNFNKSSIKKTFKEVIGMDFDLFMKLESLDKIYSGKDLDTVNPSKVMLFTDLFFNIYDNSVKPGIAQKYYKKAASVLNKGIINKDFGYIFQMEKSLAKVLELKFELSYETRIAYKENNKEKLNEIANHIYPKLLKRINEFYEDFRALWLKESKPFGFEVQDIRIGGVIQRVKYCKDRINDYLNGNITNIPELEEKILDPFGVKEEKIICNLFNLISTNNNL